MTWNIIKVLISAMLISFTSWLAGRKPGLAGFILALPLSSMLALAFSYAEFRDPDKASSFAKSIFFAVPLSLAFFVPFLFAERFKVRFEILYISGCILTATSYLLHRTLMAK